MDTALGHMRTPPALVLREHACAKRGPHAESHPTPFPVRCCAIQQMRTAMIQHSASGNETMSGEVSDPACSMPAAAVLDAFAHMLVARTLSRAASLNPRASVLVHHLSGSRRWGVRRARVRRCDVVEIRRAQGQAVQDTTTSPSRVKSGASD